MRTLRSGLLLLAGLALVLPTSAQVTETSGPAEEAVGQGLRFNGLGRTYIQQTDLGGDLAAADTTNAQALADGEFLLDLAVNAQPNRVTEVQGVLRLRNEFGGFFGAGVTVEVRELWARGILANVVEYRVGDMDLVMTPYTVFLPDADGVVNAPAVFEPQLERVAYEEFYTGRNTRRFQGGKLDFGLAFDQGIETADVTAFIARLRPTDFATTPTRLIGGGRLAASTAAVGPYGSRLAAGANLASTWDDLDSGNANAGIRNHVVTFDGDLLVLDGDALDVSVVGEGGYSIVKLDEDVREDDAPLDPLLRESDTFVEVGLEAALAERGLTVAARFVDVGPDFFSLAAQSKRVDYTRTLGQFNRVGNDRALRPIGLFDLTRDTGLYTFRLEPSLMAYDPRYSNVLPYGRATPNRRGAHVEFDLAREGVVEGGLLVAALSEIRGQGTDELKDFLLVRAHADVPVGALAGTSRKVDASFGLQFEDTSRGGNDFERVDLVSTLVEAGVAVEVYDRLDVLLGLTTRASDGRDYVPEITNFNDVEDFPAPLTVDDRETLWGGGIRYRFRDDVYLTVQAQQYTYGDAESGLPDYSLGQVFALYSMTF